MSPKWFTNTFYVGNKHKFLIIWSRVTIHSKLFYYLSQKTAFPFHKKWWVFLYDFQLSCVWYAFRLILLIFSSVLLIGIWTEHNHRILESQHMKITLTHPCIADRVSLSSCLCSFFGNKTIRSFYPFRRRTLQCMKLLPQTLKHQCVCVNTHTYVILYTVYSALIDATVDGICFILFRFNIIMPGYDSTVHLT